MRNGESFVTAEKSNRKIYEMVLSTLFTALALAQTPPPARIMPNGSVYRLATQTERKVSLHVKDASLKDVLSKLPKVDYAVDADTFKDRRITLNLTDVTVTTALNAIAAAIDAHWDTVGGVHVLKKGAGFGFGNSSFRSFALPSQPFPGDGKFEFKTAPRFELFKDGKGFQGFTPEQQKKIEKSLELSRKQFQALPDFQKLRTLDSGTTNVDALLKSITLAQKEIIQKQGFLKLSDLTAEQRKFTGFSGDGSFEMTITRGKETLKIKS